MIIIDYLKHQFQCENDKRLSYRRETRATLSISWNRDLYNTVVRITQTDHVIAGGALSATAVTFYCATCI